MARETSKNPVNIYTSVKRLVDDANDMHGISRTHIASVGSWMFLCLSISEQAVIGTLFREWENATSESERASVTRKLSKDASNAVKSIRDSKRVPTRQAV